MTHRGKLLILSALVMAVALASWLGMPRIRSQAPDPAVDPATIPAGLARRTAELLYDARAQVALDVPTYEGPVYLALRAGGRRLAEGWFEGEGWQRPLLRGIDALSKAHPGAAAADSVEVCVPHDYSKLRFRKRGAVLSNIHRGVWGLMLQRGDQRERHCPTALIAENRSFERVETLYREAHHLDRGTYRETVTPYRFRAHQLLLQLGASPRVLSMHRGNRNVPFSAVSSESTHALADGMASWMLRNLFADGRMLYLYWPSRGEESSDNNMIRQFMASVCLVRLARERGDDPQLQQAALRNLQYNFAHFFRREGQIGLIEYRGKAKLGAAALAALAIVESPFREQLAPYELALRAFVDQMQRPDGSFRTFYGSDRNDNQNFYPGEALLLWSVLYEQSGDPALLERFMRAFRHYRAWHLDGDNRNPAFVPWHTQAYVRVWQKTHSPELRDFVFEMNDWLLGVQQWDEAEYADVKGRFYAPDRPFGPPHASSTGVYLEGLIDAWKMATESHDAERAARYRLGILRGVRSLMQLQYVDDVDMYYVSQRERVEGGVRTTVYDNGIRVDNVQHSLMGLFRILRYFDAAEVWDAAGQR